MNPSLADHIKWMDIDTVSPLGGGGGGGQLEVYSLIFYIFSTAVAQLTKLYE